MVAQRAVLAPSPASPASRYEVILVSPSFRCPLRGRHRQTSVTSA
ncbi:hypothetical protein ACWCXH_24450 [Kitasatospora sp. NPDC001660]